MLSGKKDVNFKLLNMLGPLETFAWSSEAMVIAIHEKQRRRIRKNEINQWNDSGDIFVLNEGSELAAFFSQLALANPENYTCHVALYEADAHWITLLIQIQKNELNFLILDSLGGYNSSGKENHEDIDRIIGLIHSAFSFRDANSLQIYINRIQLQHDSYNCSRFALHGIYSTSPSEVFQILRNSNIQTNTNAMFEITLFNVPEKILSIFKPMQSLRNIDLLVSAHNKNDKDLRSFLKVTKKYRKFNSDKKKHENIYIEHKKDNYINQIRLFMDRNPKINDLYFLFCHKACLHITTLSFIDIVQQINDIDFWDKIKLSGSDVGIIEIFRDHISIPSAGKISLMRKISSLAREYIVSQSARLDNLYAYELCTVIYKLCMKNQPSITINDKFSLFLGENLRRDFDRIAALSPNEFQDFIQNPDIDNYLITTRDVIYILNRIPDDKRLDFLMIHASSILSRLENNKQAYDSILSALPHEAFSSFMRAPIIFRIKKVKQLTKILFEYFPEDERFMFAQANMHIIRNMYELIEIVWLLPNPERLVLLKKCHHLVKNKDDFLSLCEMLPEDMQSELMQIFPNLDINQENGRVHKNYSAFFSIKPITHFPASSEKIILNKCEENPEEFAKKSACILF